MDPTQSNQPEGAPGNNINNNPPTPPQPPEVAPPTEPEIPVAPITPSPAPVTQEAIATPQDEQAPQVMVGIPPAGPSATPQSPPPTTEPTTQPIPPTISATPPVTYPSPVDSLSSLPPSKSKKKLIIIASVGGVLFVGIILAFVFGYYLPNQPNNVWSSGLNKSGQALKSIVEQSTDKESADTIQKSEITIEGEGTFDNISIEGALHSKFDPTSSEGDFRVSIKQPSARERTLHIQARGGISEGSVLPNIYLRVAGLSSLGIESLVPGATRLDGRWIAIEEEFFEKSGITDTINKNDDPEITHQDITEVAKVLSETTSEYLLTSNPENAVLQMKDYIGKEDLDGVSTYRYEVGVNKENAKKYCTTLANRLLETNFYKRLNVTDSTTNIESGCERSTRDLLDEEKLDLWIDRKTKLIHKVRVSQNDHPESWVEFSQNYSGGDEVDLTMRMNDDVSKITSLVTITSNLKNNTARGIIELKSSEGSSKYDAKITIEAKPYEGEIDSSRPQGAISIEEVIKALSQPSTSTPSRTR